MAGKTRTGARVNYYQVAPKAAQCLINLEAYLKECGLERMLTHLIKMRVSQINGCAYCLDMHSKDLRAHGETEQRIYGLNAWRETHYYTPRERAALELAEAVTLIASHHISDELYTQVREEFTEKEFVDLLFVIAAINSWNRIAIACQVEAGHYTPPKE